MDSDCWYLHRKTQSAPESYAQAVILNQDFPQDTQHKSIPKNVTLESPAKTDKMIMEVMTMIKEQNKIVIDLIMNMNQQIQKQV